MKKRTLFGILFLVSCVISFFFITTGSQGEEPGGDYLRFVNTGCECDAEIDEGCSGFFATGYCDATQGTECTTGIDCVLIYHSLCNDKSQEDCDAQPN
jgi:hypothetical protein